MGIGTMHTRVIGALALVLATAGLLAPTALGKPTPRIYEQPNLLGSQLDRLQPQASDLFERALVATEEETGRALRAVYADLVQPGSATTIGYPDAFERAVAIRQAEIAASSAGQRHRPTISQPAVGGDDGSSFDWGLLVTLCAVAAACLALGGAALATTRGRRRVSTS